MGEYTVNQVLGGMRGIKGLFQDVSSVDPDVGLTIRGYSIPEMKKLLPTAIDGGEPLPEATLWLCLTGEIPTAE
jgi:citrate synthase